MDAGWTDTEAACAAAFPNPAAALSVVLHDLGQQRYRAVWSLPSSQAFAIADAYGPDPDTALSRLLDLAQGRPDKDSRLALALGEEAKALAGYEAAVAARSAIEAEAIEAVP